MEIGLAQGTLAGGGARSRGVTELSEGGEVVRMSEARPSISIAPPPHRRTQHDGYEAPSHYLRPVAGADSHTHAHTRRSDSQTFTLGLALTLTPTVLVTVRGYSLLHIHDRLQIQK